MARISEFETSIDDNIEVAISQAEFDNLGTGAGELELRITLFDHSGAEVSNYLLPTSAGSWSQDPETLEYIHILTLTYPSVNHAGNYNGFFLSSTNATGDDTPIAGIMVSQFGSSTNFPNSVIGNATSASTTVTSSSNIPSGSSFTLISQSNTGGSGDVTIRWDILPDGSIPAVTSPTFQGRGSGLGDTGTVEAIPCFTSGTLIKTQRGEVAIEELCAGDKVLTMDAGYQPIRWIGSRRLDKIELTLKPRLKPIRIRADALAPGLPEHDLLVSPQHRVLVRSAVAQRMFDTYEVLVPANKLLPLPGIDVEETAEEVEYVHMLFDAHQLVWSNGAITESLFTGPEALKAVSPEAREEIEALFPEICAPDFAPLPARHIPQKGKLMKKLVERHKKNQKYLVEHP